MGIKSDILVVGAAGAVLLLAAWYAKKKLTTAVASAAPYVNPADPRNLAYAGTNALGAAITGDDSFTLGGWLYDITHSGPNTSGPDPTLAYQIPINFGIINPNEGW